MPRYQHMHLYRLHETCQHNGVGPNQGHSQKFVLGGYKFLLHNTTVLYTNSLTSSAEISAQNNFQ